MIPKKFFNANNWLMIISLGLLVLILAVEILMLPFLKFFPIEFLDFIEKFTLCAPPILIGIYAASAKFFEQGFIEHKCTREKPEEKKNL